MPVKIADIPDEIWEQIIAYVNEDRYLESLSLVSKGFLSITNRLKKALNIYDPTSSFLPRLFRRFPNLRHVSFHQFHGHLDWILLQLFQIQLSIESLDLSNQQKFPAELIQSLPSSSLTSIRSLKLRNLSVLNDDDLVVIGNLMVNIEDLDLSEPRDDYRVGDEDEVDISGGSLGITDSGVSYLATKLCNLNNINLSGNVLVSDKSVISLVENCGKMEEILVKNCTFVTQKGISLALSNCVNLKAVRFIGMEIVAPAIRDPLFSARNLSELEFSYMGVSNEMLCAIAKASLPLKRFTLFHCRNFGLPSMIIFFRTYQSLEYLALEGVDCLTDNYMLTISLALRYAHTIKLNFCPTLSNSTLLIMAKNCPLLTNLEMEKTSLGKENFAVSNARNPQIRSLNISSNKSLSNECLETFSMACPNVEVIDISSCAAITRKGVGALVRSCPCLRVIQMSGCSSVKNLGVNIDLPKMEVLQASGSGINDDGLVIVGKRCRELRYLDIRCCQGISSRGVKEVVGNCTRLKQINLGWCRCIARDIVAWMVFSRPSLRKIIPPYGVVLTESEKSLFLRHGCQICEA